MAAPVRIEGRADAAIASMRRAVNAALEQIGARAAGYARALCGTRGTGQRPWPPELRESIAWRIEGGALKVGSPLAIAAYAELGTGREYRPPPEWIENAVKRGSRVPPGAARWIFYDPQEGRFRVGAPQQGRPFLRPAMQDHADEYRRVFEQSLQNAGQTPTD